MSVRPVMISGEDALIALLRGRREARGWSQAELDERIGWADAYTSKVEAPHRGYGKRTAWGITAALANWVQGLGLALVLMDRREAEALCARSDAPDMTPAHPQAYAGRARDGGVVQSRILRLQLTFKRAA